MAQKQLNAGSLGGRLLKRTIPQKVKPIPSCKSEREDMTAQVSQAMPENNRRARTSAAMIGLAVSMGAYGVPMPHQGDQALAADAPTSEPLSSDVSVPYETAKVFSGSGATPTSVSSDTQLSKIEHTVQEGQTLWDVARFYNIDAAAIAKANKLTLDSVLTVGQVIVIPADARIAQASSTVATGSASTPGYYGPVAGRSTEPQAIVALPESEENAVLKLKQDKAVDVLKQKRESLRSSLKTLKQPTIARSVAAEPVIPQPTVQEAQVPVAGKVELPTVLPQASVPQAATAQPQVPSVLASSALPKDAPTATEPNLTALRTLPQAVPSITGTGAEYRVAPGDTLANIAQIHGISLSQLIEANKITNPNYIFVDQVLVIPGSQSSVSEAQAFNGTAIASIAIPKPVDVSVPRPTVSQPFAPTPVPTETKVAAGSTFSAPPQPAQAVDASPKLLRYNQIETLKSEIDQLRARYQNVGAPQSSVLVSTAPQTAKPVAAAVVEPVNPEFNPSKYSRVSGVRQRLRSGEASNFGAPVPVNSSLPKAEPKVVAVAPLGSANYDPIQAKLGQTVSPDMPPLGASAYLPGASNQIDGYIWPAKGTLTSPYGWRWGRMHKGIDIAGPVGTPIFAAADGRVSYAGWNSGGYGYLVEIEHPDGSLTLYAHNNRILVQVGQEVAQGQQISEMGSTGYSTGPHLHFEIHPAGKGAVNPMTYLARR